MSEYRNLSKIPYYELIQVVILSVDSGSLIVRTTSFSNQIGSNIEYNQCFNNIRQACTRGNADKICYMSTLLVEADLIFIYKNNEVQLDCFEKDLQNKTHYIENFFEKILDNIILKQEAQTVLDKTLIKFNKLPQVQTMFKNSFKIQEYFLQQWYDMHIAFLKYQNLLRQ